jgi:uncharacterized protein YigE (DUF2233 family)
MTHLSHIAQPRLSAPGIMLLLVAALALLSAGCTTDANATPLAVFPTRIPPGTPLPTFVSLASPQGGTTPGPTAPGGTAISTVAPSARVTVTFRFVTPQGGQPSARPSLPPPAAQPSAIPTVDENWNSLAAGVQWRRLSFRTSDNRDVGALVVRIDPTLAQFKVIYNPGQTKLIQDWRLALPGALVVINASYFDQSLNPIGLLAVDGNVMGRSVGRSDAGLFQVQNGSPRVRFLFAEPYNNTERFDQAVQGFPVLMAQGQVAPAFDPDVAKVSARRSVIAQDAQGRILFIATPFSSVTLPDLAKWLGASGLQIDTALNLDGGNSTCLYLATGGPSEFTLNLAPVPVVIAVYPR